MILDFSIVAMTTFDRCHVVTSVSIILSGEILFTGTRDSGVVQESSPLCKNSLTLYTSSS